MTPAEHVAAAEKRLHESEGIMRGEYVMSKDPKIVEAAFQVATAGFAASQAHALLALCGGLAAS